MRLDLPMLLLTLTPARASRLSHTAQLPLPQDLHPSMSHSTASFAFTASLGVLAQAEAFAGFRGKWNLSYWVFQTHLAVNGWLHRRFPGRFGDPNLVPMMTIQRSPYSAIYARIKRPFFVVLISVLVAALALATKAVRLLAAR